MRRLKAIRPLQLPKLIRFRLTLWYTGLAALVLAAFVGGVFYAFSSYQFDSLDERAAAEAADAFSQQVQVAYVPHCLGGHGVLGRQVGAGADPCLAVKLSNPAALNKADTYVQFYTQDGQPVPASNGRPVRQPPNSPLNKSIAKNLTRAATNNPSDTTRVTPNGNYHYITVSLPSPTGGHIIGLIAAPIAHVQDQVDALRRILIYAAGVLLIISAVGGWLLAGRALRPIDEITRRARQITVHDLSQRLNLNQADELGRMAATFDDLIARLQDAFERQKRFTSDASHELRTPLTVMQADLGLALARPRSAQEYHHTLVSMEEEVVRLSTIVNDLLMLTRIDVDPAGMQHRPVAVHEVLAGLANRVRAIAAERNIAVVTERLDPVTVVGDATRLRQLFTNLLDNAVTYTPPGGRVSIAVERTRDGVRILVGDTGIGVAPEHVPHIFDRFYRAHEAREQNPHGTGLGLAISRSVVQAHHGEITVQSAPGEGTTFTVLLPADGRRHVRRKHGLRALVPGGAAAR